MQREPVDQAPPRTPMRSAERLHQVERATDLPLMILAVALIPLLVLPEVTDLPEAVHTSFVVADWLIWGVFAAVFGAKLIVAPRPLEFLRRNWLEAAMVLLPMLRPLRAARVLRLARVATAVGFNVQVIRDIFASRGTQVIAATTLAIVVIGATGVLLAERNADGANITNFGDALWWSVVTAATVGYGDRYPITPEGRGIAVALMLVGISAVSALTASIAAFIVREHEDVELDDLLAEIRALRAEVAELRGTPPPGDPPQP